jgi:hypothetical protein
VYLDIQLWGGLGSELCEGAPNGIPTMRYSPPFGNIDLTLYVDILYLTEGARNNKVSGIPAILSEIIIMGYKELLALTDMTFVQKLVVATENVSSATKDVIKDNKDCTVGEIITLILSDTMSDAPKSNIGTDDEALYSLSAITSIKKGSKPTALQKDYKAWGKLTDAERQEADVTYFFVKTATSFKSNAYRDYERFPVGHKKEGKFKFLANGEPMPRVKAPSTGNSDPTVKVEELNKSLMTRFNEGRADWTNAEQALIRGFMLNIYADVKIEKLPLPEITGDVQG